MMEFGKLLGISIAIVVVVTVSIILATTQWSDYKLVERSNNITAEQSEVHVVTDSQQGMSGSFKCQTNPRLYIDFIYNPHYYYELTILKFMLSEILNKNPNVMFYYDNRNLYNSTMITVGYEHAMIDTAERTIIQIKPKLLKDILYTDNIFNQIYLFLLTNLRVCDSLNVPEYDRSINFERYKSMFARDLREIDFYNPNVCRTEEMYETYNGRICISPDLTYIASLDFTFEETREYWITLLTRVSEFMNFMLSKTLNFKTAHDNCYSIELRPEPDIRRVLLFPHRAVKTITLDEYLNFRAPESRVRILNDIVLFKHRILHALGLGHRYSMPSVMSAYTKSWQKPNAFFILLEDYRSLWACYAIDQKFAPSVYVRNETETNFDMLNAFHSDFESFERLYTSMR